jgi:hypothetical protein
VASPQVRAPTNREQPHNLPHQIFYSREVFDSHIKCRRPHCISQGSACLRRVEVVGQGG